MTVKPIQRIVGKNLQRLRRSLGVSQQEVADAAGVSQSTISEIENLKHWPELVTLENVATALGIKVTELLQKPKQ